LTQHELGPPPRYEDPRCNCDPQAGELGPAEDLLDRNSAHSQLDQPFELVGRSRRRQQQVSLILGENTTCRSEPLN
jgi:hypothetical protein